MGDEDTIRKRLLFDGDGTGDDRRINILLKKFIKWCNNDETSKSSKEQLLAQLAQCEYSYSKSRLVAQMAFSELENYNNLTNQIGKNIVDIKEQIVLNLKEFQEAKKIKKNRLEYEVKVKEIKEQPDRKETYKKLIHLKKELQILEDKSKKLEEKFEMRKKQFHVLIASLQLLQALLDEDINLKTAFDPCYSPFEEEDME